MDLVVMILGLVLFFAAHVFTTKRDARAQAIAQLGEGTYKILYSVVSLAGLALIVWGFAHYRATGWIDIWHPPKAMKHITVALMLPAVILLSSLAGSVIGIGLILFARHGRSTPIPFGPYLALGGIAALFFGPTLASFYLGS